MCLWNFITHLPRRKESAVDGHCVRCSLISAMKFNAYDRQDTPLAFPEQYEIVLPIGYYSYVTGPAMIGLNFSEAPRSRGGARFQCNFPRSTTMSNFDHTAEQNGTLMPMKSV
jgi:hypothetical protein